MEADANFEYIWVTLRTFAWVCKASQLACLNHALRAHIHRSMLEKVHVAWGVCTWSFSARSST
eukprot:2549127-Amphidinium_carterae.1